MFEIGIVKTEGVSENFKEVAEMKLLLIGGFMDPNERLIIYPVEKENWDKYWEESFETMGKEWISDDYKYFLEYMLDGDCEITSTIKLDDLESTRAATEEDMKQCEESFNWFKEKHDLEIRKED